MSELRTTGLVLARFPIGDADRMLRVLTPDLGLISVLAKGIRKIKSKRHGAFELFTHATVTLHRRAGAELFIATEARALSAFPTDDLDRLAAAYEFAEWLLRLLPAEKPVPEIATLADDFLSSLATTERRLHLSLAAKARLLTDLGFLPEAFRDERVGKLLRFFAASPLSTCLRVALEPETFRVAEEVLGAIFASITEKLPRVTAATRAW